MTNTPEVYCSKCQILVRPIKHIVNYRCPKCGATFMASQVEQAADSKRDDPSSEIPVSAS